MNIENFQSHYNPQPPTKTPPTTNQPTSKPLTPPESVKPTTTAEPIPTLVKTQKAINVSSAST
jgi:hypothetical protein